jgi:putative two-component system response regulator
MPLSSETSTILVVDDAPANVRVLADLLHPAYHVRVATSGQRALEIAATAPFPDLILLDVMMPRLSGFDVLERLRASPATREIPVIFVTAMDGTADEERGLQSGAVDYLTKPIRPAIVLARVRTHLELKRARDRLHDQNVWLETEVARRMADNQLIQDASIHALASLAEMRDPETGNHLRRTQEYVRTLAKELSRKPAHSALLTPETIATMAKSATLHDIGKIGIPDQILLKPAKLSAHEWEIMKTHAALGGEAIRRAQREGETSVEFLTHASEIAQNHHERWNGSGYPNGLVGAAIPLSARIMALADVFDALLSRRPYKAPFSVEETRRHIVGARDTHFDPDVVDAFLAVETEMFAIAERYRDPADAVPSAQAV